MHYCHCCEDCMSGCFVECFMLSSTDIHFTEMEATFQQFSSMLFKLRSHLLFYCFRSFYLLGCIYFLHIFNIKRRFPVTQFIILAFGVSRQISQSVCIVSEVGKSWIFTSLSKKTACIVIIKIIDIW